MQLITNADGVVTEFTQRRFSNFHAHLRDGAMMQAVAPDIMRHVRYLLAMPNTQPITTISELLEYYRQLMEFVGRLPHRLDLIMTLYLTDKLTPAVIEQLARLTVPCAVKYYPPNPGATTGSGKGIPLDQCHEMLCAMIDNGIRLLGHFESVEDRNGKELPHALREGYMATEVLPAFRDKYPRLIHCFEHASTVEAVEYVKADTSGRTAMTVTPQHSLFVSDDFEEFGTGLKCMPIVKTPADRAAIVEFITSGDKRAMAGDDDAPHPYSKKDVPFADARSGCYTPHSFELYASVFDKNDALEHLEEFTALNGPAWWGLPPPHERDTLRFVRRETPIPDPVPIPGEDDTVVALGWGVEGMHLDFEIVD